MVGLVDVGGTKLLAAVAGAGPPGAAVRRATPSVVDPIGTVAGLLDEARAGRHLEAIAVSVPGPFDRSRGRLLNPPGMAPVWHGLDVAAALSRRFDCPVRLENDANCAALAEARHGAGRGHRLVLYYTVSTGIGTGVVCDGDLFLNRHDSEGGHQVLWPAWLGGPACDCGGAGCLEAIASGRALARRHGRPPEEIEDSGVWEEVGRWLGQAVVNSTALFDCDCVVFGGGVCARWEEFAPALRATVAEHLRLQPAPELRLAALGEDRNLWGALALLRG